MKLGVKEFLDTIQNPSTRKGYRQGIKKFCEYYGKTAEEIIREAVNEYKYWWRLLVQEKEWDLEELRGKDLVCTCPLEDEDGNPYPCHADFLLELMG